MQHVLSNKFWLDSHLGESLSIPASTNILLSSSWHETSPPEKTTVAFQSISESPQRLHFSKLLFCRRKRTLEKSESTDIIQNTKG